MHTLGNSLNRRTLKWYVASLGEVDTNISSKKEWGAITLPILFVSMHWFKGICYLLKSDLTLPKMIAILILYTKIKR